MDNCPKIDITKRTGVYRTEHEDWKQSTVDMEIVSAVAFFLSVEQLEDLVRCIVWFDNNYYRIAVANKYAQLSLVSVSDSYKILPYRRETMAKVQVPDMFNYAKLKQELIAKKVGDVRVVAPGKNGKPPFLGFFLNKPIVISYNSPKVEIGDSVKIVRIEEHPSLFLTTITKNIEG